MTEPTTLQPVPLVSGLDQGGTDPKLAKGLTKAENFRVTRAGSIDPRRGQTRVGVNAENVQLTSMNERTVRFGTSLEVHDGSLTEDSWFDVGKMNTIEASAKPFNHRAERHTCVDSVLLSSKEVMSYLEGTGGTVYTEVRDNLTGAIISEYSDSQDAGTKVRVITDGTDAYVCFKVGDKLVYRKILDSSTVATYGTLSVAATVDDAWDVAVYNGLAGFAYAVVGGGLGCITWDFASTVTAEDVSTASYDVASVNIQPAGSAVYQFMVIYKTVYDYDAGGETGIIRTGDMYARPIKSNAFDLESRIATLMTLGSEKYPNYSCVLFSATETDATFIAFASYSPAFNGDNYVDDISGFSDSSSNQAETKHLIINLSLSTGVVTAIWSGVSANDLILASRPFMYAGDVHAVLYYKPYTDGYTESPQEGFFIGRLDVGTDVLVIVGRVMPGSGAREWLGSVGDPDNAFLYDWLPGLHEEDDPVFRTTLQQRVVGESTPLSGRAYASGSSVTLDMEAKLQTVERGDHLYIAGSLPQQVGPDGIVEAGFAVYPEGVQVDLVTPGSSGAFVDTGTYAYKAVYMHVDADGHVTRSAPSVAVDVEILASTNDVQIAVPVLNVTRREDVKIEIYRTPDASTVRYRLLTTLDNEETADNVAIYADTGAAISAYAPYLYTDGGVLENIIPPPSKLICEHQGRMFWVNNDQPTEQIQYSRELAFKSGLQSSDILTANVPPDGGRITGIASLSGNLVVFKEERIFIVTGVGLNALGAGLGYERGQMLDAGLGCVDFRSIVKTSSGLFFQSLQGIALLTQNMQRSVIGDRVRYRTDGEVITGAVVNQESGYVVFTMESASDQSALVYSYRYNMWTTWTNWAAQSAVMVDGDIKRVDLSGYVWTESAGWVDSSGPFVNANVELIAESAWIAPGGPFRSEVLQAVYVLGHALETGATIKAAMSFDYEPHWRGTPELAVDSAFHVFDYTDYYGAGVDVSTIGKAMAMKIPPSKPHCRSFRWKISVDSAGQGISLSAVGYDLKVEKEARRYGDRVAR